jgi:type IV pilus assembly protein PilV
MQLIKRQTGVSLIEALVTLFVLSVGLLGVAGLQSTGLKAGFTATQRSLAVFHSEEIIERMRSNRAALVAYAGAGQNNGCVDTGAGASAISCTAQQLAADDVYRWRQALAAAFPAGLAHNAQIRVDDSVTPVAVTVRISWTERAGTKDADDGPKEHVYSALL